MNVSLQNLGRETAAALRTSEGQVREGQWEASAFLRRELEGMGRA